ncbi:two-component sensor histidine kinase [Cohnella sp. CFH 77786]|uniref:sensor histidine kinase n=1 Tax=Cohnella sp. CFH 77786 TaxID=2662265 RepID=UPI001C609B92|nr:two-component sensor histidine kinase [Cohnella sp. CFH 77786]
MTRPYLRWILFGIGMIHVSMLINYLLANWIMSLIYDTWFPDMGYPLGRQLLTAFLMTNLFGIGMMLIRLRFDPGRHQLNLFMNWIDAMRRMAKGDFNVTLDSDPRRIGQMGVLVRSFNEMANKLSEVEKMRQEFISNVSHEFQSPLTSIGGFARALRSDDLSPETRQHYLRIIELECARLSKLSDNLLKLTSLESKQHPFEPKPYRLDRQLRRAILSCEPQWQSKKQEIDVELPDTTIVADEDLLNQVWFNLLHNAIKFTPEGGAVRIALEERDGCIRVEVADTGIGVSEEDLPHLFERFFKADKARSSAAGGSGLGLSIVKKIVEMHGGEVTARSRPGEGTNFLVTLPRETPGGDSSQPANR